MGIAGFWANFWNIANVCERRPSTIKAQASKLACLLRVDCGESVNQSLLPNPSPQYPCAFPNIYAPRSS
jgi:hypothetical protein